MTIKEKVIHQTIARIEKRIAKINEILEARPHVDLLNLYKEFGELLNEYKGEQRFTQDFMDKIAAMDKREKKLNLAIKRQKSLNKLLDEKSKYTLELISLKNELYWINQWKDRLKKN